MKLSDFDLQNIMRRDLNKKIKSLIWLVCINKDFFVKKKSCICAMWVYFAHVCVCQWVHSCLIELLFFYFLVLSFFLSLLSWTRVAMSAAEVPKRGKWSRLCVCVCVCDRERERRRETWPGSAWRKRRGGGITKSPPTLKRGGEIWGYNHDVIDGQWEVWAGDC